MWSKWKFHRVFVPFPITVNCCNYLQSINLIEKIERLPWCYINNCNVMLIQKHLFIQKVYMIKINAGKIMNTE